MEAAKQAKVYAKLYVELNDALQAEGVPEGTAREEARWAATSWLLSGEEEYEAPIGSSEGKRCPLCGK